MGLRAFDWDNSSRVEMNFLDTQAYQSIVAPDEITSFGGFNVGIWWPPVAT